MDLLIKPDNAIVDWHMDDSLYSCVNLLDNGSVSLSFSKKVDNIDKISFGFKDFTRIIVPDKPKYEGPYNLLFNYEHDINKRLLINHPFKFEFPADTMYLPTSCFNYGDKRCLDFPLLTVSYSVYLKISYISSSIFRKKKKENVVSHNKELNFQSVVQHQDKFCFLNYYNQYLFNSNNKSNIALTLNLGVPNILYLDRPIFEQLKLELMIDSNTISIGFFKIKKFRTDFYQEAKFDLECSKDSYYDHSKFYELTLNKMVNISDFEYNLSKLNYTFRLVSELTNTLIDSNTEYITTCKLFNNMFQNTLLLKFTISIIDENYINKDFIFDTNSTTYVDNSSDKQKLTRLVDYSQSAPPAYNEKC